MINLETIPFKDVPSGNVVIFRVADCPIYHVGRKEWGKLVGFSGEWAWWVSPSAQVVDTGVKING